MWNRVRFIYPFALLGLAACTPVVPKELADARVAYQRAASGPAAQTVPADVHIAKVSLDQAEQSFSDNGDARKTRDLAYVAERKAELAEVSAAQTLDNQNKAAAEQHYQNAQARLAGQTKEQLAQTRAQLAQTQAQRDATGQQLTQEQQARASAEQRLADDEQRLKAMQDSLAKLAAVKEEARGLVITLSGSVLFPSDQSTLLPEAQTRLDQVAQALMANKERTIVIEGYTDSRGSDSHNLDLSRRRAEAVRDFLTSRGYEPDRITARGMGKDKPVASNSSAEGRANNRRVEIIVQPKASASAGSPAIAGQ